LFIDWCIFIYLPLILHCLLLSIIKPQLPSARTLLDNLSGAANSGSSVFKNPFQEAENVKLAKLEKHVKMVLTYSSLGYAFESFIFSIQVDKDDNVQIKNGKKICWNYRKGRCRFGINCTFAHDSDLNVQDVKESEIQSSSIKQDNTTSSDKPKQKKRPGMCDSLTPGIKIMKMYRAQKVTRK
jgi:hypothetical protein